MRKRTSHLKLTLLSFLFPFHFNRNKQENQALSQSLAKKKDIVVEGSTVVSPTPTILTVDTFKKFTTNYYLSGVGQNGYYTASTLKRMASIISNVEVNLNAMLNGRLYERYTPGAVVFRG